MGAGDGRRLAVVAGTTAATAAELGTGIVGCDVDLVLATADDLASRDGVDDLHRRVEALGRPIDTLVVHVTLGRDGPVWRGDGGGQVAVIDLSVRGAVRLVRLCVPSLVANRRGRIVLTWTVVDPAGRAEPSLAASLAHLCAFAEATRVELEGSGVRLSVLELPQGSCR